MAFHYPVIGTVATGTLKCPAAHEKGLIPEADQPAIPAASSAVEPQRPAFVLTGKLDTETGGKPPTGSRTKVLRPVLRRKRIGVQKPQVYPAGPGGPGVQLLSATTYGRESQRVRLGGDDGKGTVGTATIGNDDFELPRRQSATKTPQAAGQSICFIKRWNDDGQPGLPPGRLTQSGKSFGSGIPRRRSVAASGRLPGWGSRESAGSRSILHRRSVSSFHSGR